MKKFDYEEIVGHSLIQKKLRQAVATDHVVSAYLLCGSRGIGKKTIMSAFAAALLCQNPNEGKPCLSCPACRLLLSGNHPDLIRLELPADKKTIGVELVREQLIKEAYIRPFHAGRKVFIIEDGELMTAEAQNALLKILEEPPAYAVFLILSTAPDQLLETVRSRCLKLQLLPLSDSVCRQYFENLPAEYNDRKELAASFSQGVIGRGLLMLENEAYYQLYQKTMSQLAAFAESRSALTDFSQFLTQNKEYIQDIIDFMLIFLRDCLRSKISEHPKLICTDQKATLQRFLSVYSTGGLVHSTEALIHFRERLSKNASFTAAVLELLTKMQEETHG
ncbi:MAG: hypothetical protein IJF61_05245 [Clostridia bacterium]|nr:hypothetical protein [Clostridia bacterium]